MTSKLICFDIPVNILVHRRSTTGASHVCSAFLLLKMPIVVTGQTETTVGRKWLKPAVLDIIVLLPRKEWRRVQGKKRTLWHNCFLAQAGMETCADYSSCSIRPRQEWRHAKKEGERDSNPDLVAAAMLEKETVYGPGRNALNIDRRL